MNFIKTFLTMLIIFTVGSCAIYGAWIAILRLVNYPGPEWWVLPVVIVFIAVLMSLILNTDLNDKGKQ